jgi:penicillin V acylase-like amidase (Ntn superfamily)
MRRAALVVLAIAIAFSVNPLQACSTFCLKQDGAVVYGRNYDFDIGTGVVIVNRRGVQKFSLPKKDSTTASWVSVYGSVTFNQFGREYPMDGMNEAGLVVALMWLDGSVYPPNDERPALGVLEWIEYQLDRYATVSEVLANAGDVRVRGGTPLHYLIADRSGAAATIEYLDGKLVVHTGSALPTANLTNDSYASSLQYLRSQHAMPSGSGSLQRFARTAMLMAQPADGQNATDRTLDILQAVKQPNTRWSVAYDVTNLEVTWTTDITPARKSLRFRATDFACSQPPMALDVRSTMTGDVSAKLLPWSAEENRASMIDAYTSTAILGETPLEWIEQTAAHAESFGCVPARRTRATRP